MKKHTPLSELVSKNENIALWLLLKMGNVEDKLKALLTLAEQALVVPVPEQFERYYEMVLAACVEKELYGTECLTPGGGYVWINENPLIEQGKLALKNWRSAQKYTTDQLLQASFGQRLTIEPMVDIQKLMLKKLLEQALLPDEEDCFHIFWKYMRLAHQDSLQQKVFLDLIREVSMMPERTEQEIRTMFFWICGSGPSLLGKFGDRIRETVAISWQHKLNVDQSTNLLEIFRSLANCSGPAWPSVVLFAGRIQRLDSEGRRLVTAIREDCGAVVLKGTISFAYDDEGTLLILIVELSKPLDSEGEQSIFNVLRSFWKTWTWSESVHPRVSIDVKIGTSRFNLANVKRK